MCDQYASGLVCLSQEGRVAEGISKPLSSSQIHSFPTLLSAFDQKKKGILEKIRDLDVMEREKRMRDILYSRKDEVLDKIMEIVLGQMAESGKGKVLGFSHFFQFRVSVFCMPIISTRS